MGVIATLAPLGRIERDEVCNVPGLFILGSSVKVAALIVPNKNHSFF